MKKYVIKGSSKYFKDKYGTSNPTITIEGNWKELTGGSWGNAQGNPACLLFAMRGAVENTPDDDAGVLYGKIGSMGELVHVSELTPHGEDFKEELNNL